MKSAHIRNFRALEEIDIDFTSQTIVIGPNNSGKSTLITALDWFFNGEKNSIDQSDISNLKNPETTEIYVEIIFDQLTVKDAETIGPKYIQSNTRELQIRKTYLNGDTKISGMFLRFPIFDPIRAASGKEAKKAALSVISTQHPELSAPPYTTEAAVNTWMEDWEEDHPDQLVYGFGDETHLKGAVGQATINSLFEFIPIRVDLNMDEELQDKKQSTIGKILELTLDRTTLDAELSTLESRYDIEKKEIERINLNPQLIQISQKLTSLVSEFMTGPEVSLIPFRQSTTKPTTNIAIEILDKEVQISPDKQGHGFRRALIIAALQLLSETRMSIKGERNVCFAIEEPEIFQHPGQAQVFAKTLAALSNDPSERLQILVATHSPYFVNPSEFQNVRRFALKSTGVTSQIQISHTSPETIHSKYKIENTSESLKAKIAALSFGPISEGLFAQHVILVEGKTDAAFLDAYARNKQGSRYKSITLIIPVDGKSLISVSYCILNELGIKTSIMFDSDFVDLNTIDPTSDKFQNTQNDLRKSKKNNHSLCSLFGVPESDFPEGNISSNVLAFKTNLESYLNVEWPKFIDTKNRIASDSGIRRDSKNSYIYAMAFEELAKEVPESLNVFDSLFLLDSN